MDQSMIGARVAAHLTSLSVDFSIMSVTKPP